MAFKPRLLDDQQRLFFKYLFFLIICIYPLIDTHPWMNGHVCLYVHLCMRVCAPVFASLAPRSPVESDLFWILSPILGEIFFFLLKVSAEAGKRYRAENITSPKGLLRGSHFMCQTPLFQDKYLTCFVTWLNLHVLRSGLLLSEALCCEMKITGICLPNAVIQRIVN